MTATTMMTMMALLSPHAGAAVWACSACWDTWSWARAAAWAPPARVWSRCRRRPWRPPSPSRWCWSPRRWSCGSPGGRWRPRPTYPRSWGADMRTLLWKNRKKKIVISNATWYIHSSILPSVSKYFSITCFFILNMWCHAKWTFNI